MHRRHLLRWSGASLILVSTHPWLAGCSEGTVSKQEPRLGIDLDPEKAIHLDFADCVERARCLGKPVLVFIAPPEAEYENHDPREWVADFLASADDELWCDLALSELACASAKEIEAVIPRADLPSSALFAVIEHSASGPRIELTVDQPIADLEGHYRSEDDWLPAQTVRFAGWKFAVHRMIAVDRRALQRRADEARAAIGPAACARVEEHLCSGKFPHSALLAGAAAIFVNATLEHPEHSRCFRSSLIMRTRASVLRGGFSGAGWEQDVGCGSSLERFPRPKNPKRSEEESKPSVACGMGSMQDFSNRFLWFYTDGNR